jgi:predicted ATPase/signal transduction histidine kinase/ActR/RegA family two-component response regulator
MVENLRRHGLTALGPPVSTATGTLVRVVAEDGRRMLAKQPGQRERGRNPVDVLRRDFELSSVGAAGVLPAVEWMSGHDYVIALFDDPGEGPFVWGGRASCDEALRVARALAAVLERMHAASLVHGGLEPSSIWGTLEDGLVLTNLGAGFRAKRTRQRLVPVLTLPLSLAYAAPEQTGRLNRAVDHRADLYSLGVLLYAALAGRLPFEDRDPTELVYAHLVRPPAPLVSVGPCGVHLGPIVERLLAKDPDDRFMSATELRMALDRLGSPSPHEDVVFPGASERLALSERILGREVETRTLLEAFSTTCQGKGGLLCVTGFSGIGKTSLVREVYVPLTQSKGRFAQGKIDQFSRGRPYGAILDALGRLVRDLACESDAELADLRSRFSHALGPRTTLVLDAIPDAELFIPRGAPLPPLPQAEAQNRFDSTFVDFLSVVVSADRPLVIFIDDLQWIDDASLRLLKSMLLDTRLRRLLLIVAYRDNEVSPDHPVSRFIEAVRRETISLTHVELGPISQDDCRTWFRDSFQAYRTDTSSLSDLIFRLAGGNPFYINEALRHAVRDGILQRVPHGLHWDTEALAAEGYTDNVVELLSQRIQSLPPLAKSAISVAACVGTTVPASQLGELLGLSPDELSSLATSLSDDHLVHLTLGPDGFTVVELAFAHDRIQQAAHSRLAPEERAAIHRDYARVLARQEGSPASVFHLANHSYLAHPVLSPDEVAQCRRYCYRAACAARESASYEIGREYCEWAMRDLSPEGTGDREFDHALYSERIRLEYLSGRIADADGWVDHRLASELDPSRRAELLHQRVVHSTLLAQYDKAIRTAIDAFALLGVELSLEEVLRDRDADVALVSRILGNDPVRVLRSLPDMPQGPISQAMGLLVSLGPPCYRSQPELWGRVVALQMRFLLQHGVHPGAGYAVPAWGGLSVYLGQEPRAEALCEATFELVKRFDSPSDLSIAYLMVGSSLRQYAAPFPNSLEDFDQAYEVGVRHANLQYAVYAFGHASYYLLFSGVRLDYAADRVERSLEFARRRSNQWGIDLLEGIGRVIADLRGQPVGKPEAAYVEGVRAHANVQVDCKYHVARAFAQLVLAEYPSAREAYWEARPKLLSVATQGLLPWVIHRLVGALLTQRGLPGDGTGVRRVEEEAEWFDGLARHCHANFAAMALLVRAKAHSLAGRSNRAIRHLESAARIATELGQWPLACLAHTELSAALAARALPASARSHDADARRALAQWGVGDLSAPPHSESSDADSPSSGTVHVDPTGLDLELLLRTMNDLSEQRSPADLCSTFVRRMAMLLGTPRAFLFGRDSADRPALLEAYPPTDAGSTGGVKPLGMIRAATHLQKPMVYPGDHSDRAFQDEYFSRRDVASAIAIPLPGRLTHGFVLFAEHPQIADAFARVPIEVIVGAARQLDISLHNAELMAQLRSQVEATEAKQRALEVAHHSLVQRERELVIEKDRAESASRAKSEFLAVMSHEIRTPLNGVIGICDVLSMTALTSKQTHFVELIQGSGKQLLRILNDILDLSRIEAGRATLVTGPFSLRAVLEDLASAFEPQATRKGIVLSLTLSAQLPATLSGDEQKLRQVLTNLIGNAIKFTSQGTITIRVLPSALEPPCTVTIEVSDTGVGIPEDKLESIFDPFVQVDSSATRRAEGTGLGLSICQRLVRLMGGTMHVSSGPSGSTFRVELPFGPLPAEVGSREDRRRGVAEEVALRTALIVDDSQTNRLVLELMLQQFGVATESVVSGRDAVERARASRFDVILMDVQMPEMDGITACRLIRESEPDGVRVPIVGVTADAMPGDRERCLKGGMDDYLAKPVQLDALKSLLVRVGRTGGAVGGG